MPLLIWGLDSTAVAPPPSTGGVDTAYKRRAMMGLGQPWLRRLPIPDGGFAQDDRRFLVMGYARTAGFPPPSGGGGGVDNPTKRRSMMNIGLSPSRRLPIADGAITGADRGFLIGRYTRTTATPTSEHKVLMFFT